MLLFAPTPSRTCLFVLKSIEFKSDANAINLEYLVLQMEDGFTDEAGVVLAEALTLNKTLRMLLLDDSLFASDYIHTKATLGAQAYEAFGAMLRVNTSIDLDLLTFDDDLDDERDVEHFSQMLIEKRLNKVGRGNYWRRA
jgi:hypothetical protein